MSIKKLIVFLKYPEIGKVKTRIASKTNELKALSIYKSLIEVCFDTISGVEAEKSLYYTPILPIENSYKPIGCMYHLQTDGDLGNRMYQAFKDNCNGEDVVILIGSDCPYLTKDILNDGFNALKEHDLVLGPTVDGGYYLIGMKQAHNQLFKNIKWSTSSVFSETIDKILKSNLSCHFLPKLNDIDEIEDWIAYEKIK